MKISIIAAMTPGNQVIGHNNDLPWRLPSDLKRFKTLTTGKPIIMGRKTYESIGRPLPNRTNVIITRNEKFKAEDCEIFHSFDDAIEFCRPYGEAMVIGGSRVYESAMAVADELLISFVLGPYIGDTFFPHIGPSWELISTDFYEARAKDDCPHVFCTYARKR